MKKLWISLLSVCLVPTTGWSANNCQSLFFKQLRLPKSLLEPFAIYEAPEYLAPLTVVRIKPISRKKPNHRFLFSLSTADERAQSQLSINGEFEIQIRKRAELYLKEVVMTPGIGAGYAYRLLLAHILKRYPEISVIECPYVLRSDYDLIRQHLAQGNSFKKTLRAASPAYQAFSAFGFRLAKKQKLTRFNPDQDDLQNYHHPAQIYFNMRLVRD